MKIFKKILCTLLVVVMCLTAAPLDGFVGIEWTELNFGEWFSSKASAATVYESGIYKYEVKNGKATIISVNKNASGEIVVPSQFKRGLGILGTYDVASIFDAAFIECKKITSIKIPENVTEIGVCAFQYCTSLTSITLPSTLKKIGCCAFSSCTSLKTLNIPKNVKEIEDDILAGSTSLEKITVNKDNQYFCSEAGVLFNKDKTKLYAYPPARKDGNDTITSYIMPSTVKTIVYYAFALSKLKSIVISEDIDTIQEGAFVNCALLEKVYFAGKPQKIDAFAFEGCNKITDTYFVGSKNDWKSISIGAENQSLTKKLHYNYEINPVSAQKVLDNCKFDIKSILSNISFKDGKIVGPTITVLGKKVQLFSYDAAVNIPILKYSSVTVDENNKLIKVLIGVNDGATAEIGKANNSTTYWSESYQQVKNLYSKATGKKVTTTQLWNDFSSLRGKLKKINGSMGVSCNTYLAGYLEFSYAKNTVTFKEGGILAECGFNTRIESRWTTFPAAYVALGFSAKANGTLIVKKESTYTYTGEIAGTLGASFGVGLGSRKADTFIEGSMKGNIVAKMLFPFKSMTDSFSLKLTGKLEVEAFGLGYKLYYDEFEFPEYTIYPQAKTRSALMSKSFAEVTPIAKQTEREYVTTNALLTLDDYTFRKENMYPFSSPSLIALDNDQQMLIWVDDDGTKSNVNRTSIYYSVYDGKIWSSPKLVESNDGYNDAPEIATFGDKVYLVWRKTSKMDDSAKYDDLARNIELYYSVYENGDFSEPLQITDNELQEFNHQIFASEKGIMISWVENSENDIFMSTGKNYVKMLSIIENDFSYDTLFQSNNPVTAISYCTKNDDIAIYSLMVEDDRSIIYESFNSENNIVYETDNQISFIDSYNDSLIFIENNTLVLLDRLSMETNTLLDENISNYELISTDTHKAIFTLDTSDGKATTLYVSNYDEENNNWLPFVPLVSEGKYIRSYDPIINNMGEPQVVINTLNINTDSNDNKLYDEAELYILNGNNYFDLIIGDYIGYDEANLKQETFPVTFDVTNISSKTLLSFGASLNFDNISNQTKTVECCINPGETQTLTVLFETPKIVPHQEMTLSIFCEENTENNQNNNSITTTIGYADVVVEKVIASCDECKGVLKVTIANIGYDIADEVEVFLIDNNSDCIINSITLDELSSNTTEEPSFIIPNKLLTNLDDNAFNQLRISIKTESTEVNVVNNIADVTYKDFKNMLTDEDMLLEHNLVLTNKLDSTCTKYGESIYNCTKCDFKTTRNIEPSHKNTVKHIGVEATCEINGHTYGVYCSDCETWITGHNVLLATGHTFNEGESKCSNCDYNKSEGCSCKCHSTNLFTKLIWKITIFFNKLFKKNKECACGIYHY